MKKLFRLGWLQSLFRGTRSTLTESPYQTNNVPFPEPTKHRQFVPLYDLIPKAGINSYIAPNATLVGQVTIGVDSVVWYNAVLRGDINEISTHSNVIIGERTVIHTAPSLPNGIPAKVFIGMYSVIQSNCTLYSCTLGNEVFVGHRTVIMEGAKLEDGCAIGPNSVVPPGRIIPANQLWAGNPVQYVRDLEQSEVFNFNTMAKLNNGLGSIHNYEFISYNSAYLQKENSEDDINPQKFTGISSTTADEEYRTNVKI